MSGTTAARALCAMLLVAAVIAGAAAGARAQSQPKDAEFQPKARQAVLMDAETGALLFQHNGDQRMSPASMSKLMTLEMLFRALKSGQLKPTDEFVMSVNAWRTGGAVSGTSAMMVPVNQKARLDELVLGIVVQSGNDAAISVAEGMAGSEAEFARLMTERGRQIGLKSSTFKNSTGLYHAEHLTTARDLAILAQHLIKEYPDQYAQFALREFKYRMHRFYNRNPLLALEIGADGLKTGFIKESGYGMVASARQGDRRLIAVVNGLDSANERRDEARKLLEWGFRVFTEFKLFDVDEIVGHARVYGGRQFYVPVKGASGVTVILPKFPANQRLRADIVYTSPLRAPIRKGDLVARLRVTNATSAVNEVPLYAAEDIEAAGVMRRGIDSLAHLAFGWLR